MKLYIFNPENDLALADGNANYCPPPSAAAIADDLATLPLWYAGEYDYVLASGVLHGEYRQSVSRLFPLPVISSLSMLPSVDVCMPWGWSAQMRRRLSAAGVNDAVLPSVTQVERLRELSSRRTSVTIMRALNSAGIDTPYIPVYLTTPDAVARFIESMPRSVIKAPWSGSGKGIAWGIGRVELPVEHFYRGVIKRQGGVVCEPFLDKVVDFALEFSVGNGRVSFAGYSLFTCAGSAYSGNILACDEEVEIFICRFIDRNQLHAVRDILACELERLLVPVGYSGFLGVDMLVYRCAGGGYALNPCVELNLRMNMGAVSRIFYDRFVAAGCTGRFVVANYRKAGDALAEHEKRLAGYPPCIVDGRLAGGYMNLSPVSENSRYTAFVVVEEGGNVAELYGAD